MRNVSRGLASRTKIIGAMEQGRKRVPEIGEKAGLSNSCVAYHLKLLLKQRVVTMTPTGRAGVWNLTKYGQERLL